MHSKCGVVPLGEFRREEGATGRAGCAVRSDSRWGVRERIRMGGAWMSVPPSGARRKLYGGCRRNTKSYLPDDVAEERQRTVAEADV